MGSDLAVAQAPDTQSLPRRDLRDMECPYNWHRRDHDRRGDCPRYCEGRGEEVMTLRCGREKEREYQLSVDMGTEGGIFTTPQRSGLPSR